MSARRGYNTVAITGAKERCSSCELLNILGKPKYGQKRCRDCIEKENKRKMQMKHIPVHLRKRTLTEQTEKASRILSAAAAEENGNANEDVMNGASPRDDDLAEDEPVKVSDILELSLELLDLVESHVARSGDRESIARFERQIRVLREGRDSARTLQGHLEDKRAILLAFSLFTEHYTLLVREVESTRAKNRALKQLAYDTAGLVKKSESQFESYVEELKSLQGQSADSSHATRIELTQLRNEVTSLKLELNLRTNELREVQLESNAQAEQLRRERERAEAQRKDKDARITSLLAQLQQTSLDAAHEKSARLRLEREADRLWADRMAYRSDQLRSAHLSAADRLRATERESLERREWLEWRKQAAVRDVAAKERLRSEASDARRSVEADAAYQMAEIRRELGSVGGSLAAEDTRPSTIHGRTKEQRASEREATRRTQEERQRERDYWLENETRPAPPAPRVNSWVDPPPSSSEVDLASRLSPLSQPDGAAMHAQRWHARMARQNEEEEIDRQIAELRKRAEFAPRAPHVPDPPATGVIRAGNYTGGVESVLNPRDSPALPMMSEPAAATVSSWPPRTATGADQPRSYDLPAAAPTQRPSPPIAYQPLDVAASIPPPVATYALPVPVPQASASPVPSSSPDLESQMREVQRQIDELRAENDRKSGLQQAVTKATVAPPQQPTPTGSVATIPVASHRQTPSTTSIEDAIEAGLRRSRQIRGESARVSVAHSRVGSSSTSVPLTAQVDSDSDEASRDSNRSREKKSHRRPRRDRPASEDEEEQKYVVESDSRSSTRSSIRSDRASNSDRERTRGSSHRRRQETEEEDEESTSSSRRQPAASRSSRDRRAPEVSDSVTDLTASETDDDRVSTSSRASASRASRTVVTVTSSSSRTRDASRDRHERRHATKYIDGREAEPVRQMTLYKIASRTRTEEY